MYLIKTIQECLSGLLGFRQTTHPDYPKLSEALIATESGMTFQDVHPLINIENIVSVVPNFAEHSTAQEEQAELLNNYLIDTVKAATQKLVNAVFQKKKLERNTKTIFQDVQLYHGSGLYTNKIIKQNRFVGFEINLKNATDLAVIISEIGTQFDTTNPDLKLYLFGPNKAEPIATFPLALTTATFFEWSKIAKAQITDATLQGGPFYLGYYEADLVGQALRRTEDLTRMPCQSCTQDNITAYNKWSQHVSLRPFYISAGDFEPETLWEPGLLTYVNDTNWGLNLKLSVQCDLSNFICRHSSIFTDALGLQVAVDLIEQMAYSVRDNAQKEKLKPLAFAALENSPTGTPGLKKDLAKAIDALEFDLSGFDSRCLPCQNKPGIKYKAM